jgi:hypothetical protein
MNRPLEVQDVSDVFSQPSNGPFAARPNDPNHTPEHSQGQVLGLLQTGGQYIETGMNAEATNTGAPPAPHAGDRPGAEGLTLIRQTLRS